MTRPRRVRSSPRTRLGHERAATDAEVEALAGACWGEGGGEGSGEGEEC